LHLLKDEFPDVRLNIISKLEQVNEGMGTRYGGELSRRVLIHFSSHRNSTLG
jgi:hypothetical protein